MNDDRATDRQRAVTWAKEHWHVAGFICACLPVLAAVLVRLNWMTERTALIAVAVAVAYVLLVTWLYTSAPKTPKSDGGMEP